MQTRSWDKDGVKQYRTEIVADRVQFGPRTGGGDGGGGAPASASKDKEASAPEAPEYPTEDINPEDIPF